MQVHSNSQQARQEMGILVNATPQSILFLLDVLTSGSRARKKARSDDRYVVFLRRREVRNSLQMDLWPLRRIVGAE